MGALPKSEPSLLPSFGRAVTYRDLDDLNAVSVPLGTTFSQLGRGALRSDYRHWSAGRLLLSVAAYSGGVRCETGAFTGTTTLVLPVEGTPSFFVDGEVTPGQARIVRAGQEALMTAPGPFAVAALVVPTEALERCSLARFGRPFGHVAPGARVRVRHPARMREVLASVASIDRARWGGAMPGRPREVEESILDAVLACLADEPVGPPDAGRFRVTRRAEALLRVWLDADVPLGDLARELGTTLRTVEMGFREVYGTTPRAYRAALRLNAAHRELLSAPKDLRVSEVALRHGNFHLGRFSVEYRRMFGETPSETLARSRASRPSVAA